MDSVYTYIMPRVNVYIRKEDWEAWESLADKPDWLHQSLAKGPWSASEEPVGPEEPEKPVKPLQDQINRIARGKRGAALVRFCQHGSAFGLCKFGCKK